MQKKFLFSYLFIIAALLLVMSISRATSEKIRGESVALVSPLWGKLGTVKKFVSNTTKADPTLSTLNEEVQRLELENQLLSNELSYLHSLFDYQQDIQSQVNNFPLDMAEEARKALPKLAQNLKLQIHAIPARVLMRSFDTWNSSLWINVGSDHNKNYPKDVIAKNSPVLFGNAVVGVIDYVDTHQSRVRLITDTGLNPSVRAARGGEQEAVMGEQIDGLINWIKRKKLSQVSVEDKYKLLSLLTNVKSSLHPFKKSIYLAKGELQGSSKPSSRGFHPFLKGIGFNYDFADEEGEGRDLRTGKPFQGDGDAIAILKVNDILVTTGMDGVFPPGLKVATVTKIELLKEGDYYYELEAKSLVSNLHELDLVFVISPQK
jgi:rod shape-determining protein MreC